MSKNVYHNISSQLWFVLLVGAVVFGGGSGEALEYEPGQSFETTTGEVSFQTSGKSIWGPDSLGSFSHSFSGGTGWQEQSGGVDATWRIWVPDLSPPDFGHWEDVGASAEIVGHFEGDFAFVSDYVQLGDGGGKVSVNYPMEFFVEAPVGNSFRRGQEICLKTRFVRGPSFSTSEAVSVEPPMVGVDLSTDVSIAAGLSFDLYVTAIIDESIGIIPSFDQSFTIPLLSVGQDEVCLPSLGIPVSLCRNLPSTYDLTDPSSGSWYTGLTGTVSRPFLNGGTPAHSLDSGSGAVQVKFNDTFIDLTWAMNKMIDNYVKTVHPTWTFRTEVTLPDFGLGVSGQATLLGLPWDHEVTWDETLRLEPSFYARVQFPETVSWKAMSGSTVLASGTSQVAAFPAGADLWVIFPADRTDPMTSTTWARMEGQFSNTLEETYSEKISARVLGFMAEFPGVTHLPDINTGYAFNETLLQQTYSYTPFDGEFSLDGFGELPALSSRPQFALDPENPIIAISEEVSDVQNNGGGNRTVTYTYKLENQGDVPLYHVQIVDDLAATFSEAQWFEVVEVVSCDLEVNENFDGKTDLNLLTDEVGVADGGNDLQVGETAVVVMKVTVAPGPSPYPGTAPFPFTNHTTAHGTSAVKIPYIPNGTPVSAESESTVNLGPAQITSLYDFALYANHKLQLHEAADSVGTIGSNDMIEVLHGNSGILAGDIRAIGHIAVHGSLTADYVFTNERAIMTGYLGITGHLEEGFDLTGFDIPVFSVAPGTQAVSVGKNTTVNLAPGAYGNVTVGSGAQLRLQTGAYNFRSFLIDPLAVVYLDSLAGPIDIRVQERVVIGEGAEMVVPPFPASTRDITLYIQKEGDIHILDGAVVRGNLIAPFSKLTFKSSSRLLGAAYANMIVVENGASFEYHRGSAGALYLEFDANCNGIPDCLEPGGQIFSKGAPFGCNAGSISSKGFFNAHGDMLVLTLIVMMLCFFKARRRHRRIIIR